MGKFDGVLLASDFDNTMVWTEEALRRGTSPEMPERNREALRYFMEQGGKFAVSTGRAIPAFRRFVDQVPMNAPGVVCNGAALYDFQKDCYIYSARLDEQAKDRAMELLRKYPAVGCEVYHESDMVHAVQPNKWTQSHQKSTRAPYEVAEDLWSVEEPCNKFLFEGDPEELARFYEELKARPWSGEYEMVFSNEHMLELTAQGANKGGMLLRLADMLGISREHIYCAGDHANDMPMLAVAAEAFAPENAIKAVRACATVVCHCKDGAIADIIGLLEKKYA